MLAGLCEKVDCQYKGLGPQPANDESSQEHCQEGKHTPCDSKRIINLVAELPLTEISPTKYPGILPRPWNNNGDEGHESTEG